ncbi:MAG: hypothetical protein C1943_01650 [Halochromatium sp.]|nr:hypothetical protein [Halochromatium sp.]
MKQVAPLRYDVIFKKAFSEPDIFAGFVEAMTGVTVNIDHVDTEKRFDPPIGLVDSRFDLYAEDHVNRIVIDIQHVKLPDHYHRFLHYHCAAILEQVAAAKDYRPPLQVLTLVVLTSGDRHQVEYASIDFDPKDLQGQPLGEIAHRVIYLCPKYVSDATPEPYREWLQAIADSLDEEVDESAYQNPLIHKIFGLIARDGLTPQDRARMKDEYGYEAIGRDQFEKGVVEGEAKGEAKAQTAIARQMLAHGLAPDAIAQLTGVPLATVEGWTRE